ncbi:GntR family transcriptional regulator [Bifidobacterium subtile]|jgi:DNA-binding GntR family transcriptional regulator|uniref:GntR family transcriptional regulator n=1 Tax=Bifidobacterium subtile TaxID=77635 RepID=A0A087E8U3_9BIFI|nr:GntR family transcriptional regulator [Bifidobacterium subtile]KFJ04194.1 GntR family transcriptional regulator [Bifidobacterium subtile]QOL36784.1 GntR family transcriptional regulator [Bifidobacterium subtile]
MTDNQEQQRTLSEKAYFVIRQKIMSGDFSPYTRLAEANIGRQIGMSRTPIREALVRLSNDGLIHKSNGGYFVAQPDFSDIAELYELRILLEKHGIYRGIARTSYDADALQDIHEAWETMRSESISPDPGFVLRDEGFHVSLLRAAGNQVMGDHLESVNLRIRSVRMYDFITQDRIDWTIDTHLSILDSVMAGRMAEAQDKLERHIIKSMQVVESRASSALRQMMNVLSDNVTGEGEKAHEYE